MTPSTSSSSPSPEHARLVAALRESKERTGLSLAGLAARTAFSKSSWERYLNGRTLPPRAAVQELCRLAGDPEGRCLALWEIAESQWSGRATEAASPATPPPVAPAAPAPAPEHRDAVRAGHRTVAVVAVLASVCAVAVGGVVLALLLLPHQGGAARPSASAASPGPRCRAATCEGRNPMAMFCAARPDTLSRHRLTTGAWMELRSSKECGTSWARMWGTRVGDRLELTAGGRTHAAEIKNGVDADSFVYTPMTVTRPGTAVRACFRPAAGGAKQCFDGRAA